MSIEADDKTTRNIMEFLRKETKERVIIALTPDGKYAVETRIGLAFVIGEKPPVITLTCKSPLGAAFTYLHHVIHCSRLELDHVMDGWVSHILGIFKVMALEKRIQRLDRFAAKLFGQ